MRYGEIRIFNNNRVNFVLYVKKSNKKILQIHCHYNGIDTVDEAALFISYKKKLKELGAKRRTDKDTKKVFYLIQKDYLLIL